jgi:predicted Zn-dependent peptidase
MDPIHDKNLGQIPPKQEFGDPFAGPAEGMQPPYCRETLTNTSSFAHSVHREALDTTIEEGRLANGMRVVIAHQPGVQTVTVGIRIDVGALNEKPGQYGIAHFLEHALGARNRNAPLFDDVSHKMTETLCHGETGLNETFFSVTVMRQADGVEGALSRLRNLVLDPEISSEIEIEKQVIYRELNTRGGNGNMILQGSPLLRQHPRLTYSIIGNGDDIAGISLQDLQRFYLDHYQPNNMTLYVSGGTDYLTTAQIENEFGAVLPMQPQMSPHVDVPKYSDEGLTVTRFPSQNSTLCCSFLAPASNSEEVFCRCLSVSILEKLLFRNIRHTNGQTYGHYLYLNSGLPTGITISTSANVEDTARIYKAMESTLKDFYKGAYRDVPLDMLKRDMTTSICDRLTQKGQDYLSFLSAWHNMTGRYPTFGHEMAVLNAMDIDKVGTYITKYFAPERAHFLVTGPVKKTVTGDIVSMPYEEGSATLRGFSYDLQKARWQIRSFLQRSMNKLKSLTFSRKKLSQNESPSRSAKATLTGEDPFQS